MAKEQAWIRSESMMETRGGTHVYLILIGEKTFSDWGMVEGDIAIGQDLTLKVHTYMYVACILGWMPTC